MPSQQIPIQPKDGYNTVPTWSEIEQMSDDQLRRVSNFTIFNHFGQIEFLGDTDLTNVDLAEAVTI
jgi:Nucleoporin autopeptidase